jgi:translocator protein
VGELPQRRRPVRNPIIGLLGWLVLSILVAAVGAIASVEAPSFYAQLQRPPWAPPGWVFGPVWTTLYVLMALAAWLVWREGAGTRRALSLYVVQLAVNALWSWLFFGWHRGALAFFDAGLLALLIAATMYQFARHRRLAAVLLLPYLAWVSFATALTWWVWQNNPELLS